MLMPTHLNARYHLKSCIE